MFENPCWRSAEEKLCSYCCWKNNILKAEKWKKTKFCFLFRQWMEYMIRAAWTTTLCSITITPFLDSFLLYQMEIPKCNWYTNLTGLIIPDISFGNISISKWDVFQLLSSCNSFRIVFFLWLTSKLKGKLFRYIPIRIMSSWLILASGCLSDENLGRYLVLQSAHYGVPSI